MAIIQTIAPMPTPPSSQDPANFSTRADAYVSAMGDFTTQINTAIGQINSTETNINSKESISSSAANNAAISATQAQTAANLATAVVIPTTATYSYTQQDWRQSMMSKAEFNAMAALNRNIYAGSGHIEFGKHLTVISNINDGMWVTPTAIYVNKFALGREATDGIGISKTGYPLLNINGVALRLYGFDILSTGGILLPQAPTVLPYIATLTQQQIDSGVIKHADDSNSGLIVNGKFDTDTSGWTVGNTCTLSVSGGKLLMTATGADMNCYQLISGLVVGKKYIVELNQGLISTSYSTIRVYTNDGATIINGIVGVASSYNTFEFTATQTSHMLRLALYGGVVGSTIELDNIAIFPADAISRSDLVFLESWHEDVSEKDFVYPLGNVQYLGTTGDSGTPVAGAFAGSATYSLFSDTWQADSALVGKGYVWSTLSDANKKAFVANPENNCYLDGDKVIQVRYRMRVVMGLGDSWDTSRIDPNIIVYNTSMSYSDHTYNAIQLKGKAVSITNDLGLRTSQYGSFWGKATSTLSINNNESGAFLGSAGTTSSLTTQAYEGKCFALPIALVHRRNQGAYHPVYNSNGTKLASDSLPWYSTSVSFTSITDCFTDSKLLTASGYIGTTTGRVDGIFYDQIHEGDITDLRMGSHKVQDYNRLIDREFNKAVAGTIRGLEKESFTESKFQTTTGTVATVEVNDGTKYSIGDVIQIYDLTAGVVKGRFVVKTISTNTLTVDSTFAKLANIYVIGGMKK